MLKINTTHSCALSWLEKLKSKDFHIWSERRGSALVITSSETSFQHPFTPRKMSCTEVLRHRDLERPCCIISLTPPAIAGNHSIEILFIPWSTFTTERSWVFFKPEHHIFPVSRHSTSTSKLQCLQLLLKFLQRPCHPSLLPKWGALKPPSGRLFKILAAKFMGTIALHMAIP